MINIESIQNFAQFEVLADPRRLYILKLLMSRAATLTQLGERLGEHPAWVRHHVKRLEQDGLIEMVDVRVVSGYVEKYYRAKAGAFLFQQIILPDFSGQNAVVLLGSDDLALNLLALHLQQHDAPFQLVVLPVGSLDGLVALRQGLTQLSGCHLLDRESGEYNRPYVRHIFPGCSMILVTLAQREQGLAVSPGNPLGLRSLEDLVSKEARIINRNPGSGTRIWLDQQLTQMGVETGQVRGCDQEAYTHKAVAQAVLEGVADAGIVLAAVARQYSLGFIPLFQERYDLVIPASTFPDPHIQSLLAFLRSHEFRRSANQLDGYHTEMMGEELRV